MIVIRFIPRIGIIHLRVLHNLRSSADPEHFFPPWSAGFVFLQRPCEPEPHVLEHLDQPLQFVQEQSTGHGLVLHDLFSSEDPEHSFPPWRAGFVSLERIWLPAPQVFVQDDQLLQSFQVQSTGQGLVLSQYLVSSEDPEH